MSFHFFLPFGYTTQGSRLLRAEFKANDHKAGREYNALFYYVIFVFMEFIGSGALIFAL